jgi:ribose 5-phosphate isomerase B
LNPTHLLCFNGLNMNPILIASDHAGTDLKSQIQKLLKGQSWEDLGPPLGLKVDYPDFAETLCLKLKNQANALGILICGSGIGMSITANRFSHIRAALVENPVSARLAREHNDANVLCLGARFLAPEYAAEIVETFLRTPFSQDPRHQGRLNKIAALPKKSGVS